MLKRKTVFLIFGPIIALNIVMVLNAPSRTDLEELRASRAKKRQPQAVSAAKGAGPTIGVAAISAEPIFGADQFLRRYPGAWQFSVEKDQVKTISGATISGGAEKESFRRNFANSLAPLFKATIQQLAQTSLELSRNDKTVTYRIDQVVNGVQVAGAGIVIFVRPEDNAIYAVRNELKDIKLVNDQGAFTAEQATDALKAVVAEAQIKGNPDRVFQVGADGIAQLCWEIEYVKGDVHRVAFVATDKGNIVSDVVAAPSEQAKVAHAADTEKRDAPPQ